MKEIYQMYPSQNRTFLQRDWILLSQQKNQHSYTRNYQNQKHKHIRLKVSAGLASGKTPPPNLIVQKRREITTRQKDLNITILPADKGRRTVILNTANYTTQILSLLSDSTTYERLNNEPHQRLQKEDSQVPSTSGPSHRQETFLQPGLNTPCIYGLPKTHKEGTNPSDQSSAALTLRILLSR